MKKESIYTLDDAVHDYVRDLSAKRREELAALFINSHASWSWYAEVIERYSLRDLDSRIVANIVERFPDDAEMRFVESDFSGPVFEAGVILREAKKLVLATSNRTFSNLN